MSQPLSQELINDYVDDRLEPAERERVEAHLRQNEEDAEAVRQLQRLRTQLRKSRRYKLDDQFSNRVLAAIQAQGNGVAVLQAADEDQDSPSEQMSPSASGGGISWRTAAAAISALAATLLLAFIIIPKNETRPVAENSLAEHEQPPSGEVGGEMGSDSTEADEDAPMDPSAGLAPPGAAPAESLDRENLEGLMPDKSATAKNKKRSDPNEQLDEFKAGADVVGGGEQMKSKKQWNDSTSDNPKGDVTKLAETKKSVNDDANSGYRPREKSADKTDSKKLADAKSPATRRSRGMKQASPRNRARGGNRPGTESAIPPSMEKAVEPNDAGGGGRFGGGNKSKTKENEKRDNTRKSMQRNRRGMKTDGEADSDNQGWQSDSEQTNQRKEESPKEFDMVENRSSKATRKNWEPLEIVTVSTTLTADDIAAINEFSVAQAKETRNGGTYFSQQPKSLGGKKKVESADKKMARLAPQYRQQTMMFTVEATEEELDQLLTKIGGQSISMGQLKLRPETVTLRQPPSQLTESEKSEQQEVEGQAGEPEHAGENSETESMRSDSNSDQRKSAKKDSGQSAEAVRKSVEADEGEAAGGMRGGRGAGGGGKVESSRGRRQQAEGPLVQTVPTQPKYLRRLEASDVGTRLKSDDQQRKRYLLLVQLVPSTDNLAEPARKNASEAGRVPPKSDK